MSKQKLLILLIFTLLSGRSFAQKEFNTITEFGVKGGMFPYRSFIVGNIEGTPLMTQMVGGRFLYVSEKHLGMILELNYLNVSDAVDKVNYQYSCVELPFLAQINFAPGNSLIGINFGSFTEVIASKDPKLYLDNDVQFGMAAGLSYSYAIKKLVLTAEGRYHYGFTTNNTDDETMRPQWVEFSVAISWRKLKPKS
jgi:hypothetical protein